MRIIRRFIALKIFAIWNKICAEGEVLSKTKGLLLNAPVPFSLYKFVSNLFFGVVLFGANGALNGFYYFRYGNNRDGEPDRN